MKRGKVLLLLYCLIVCSCNTNNDIKFLRQIEKELEADQEEFIFNDATDFEWEEVCLFYPADSAPESGYWRYEEYITNSRIDVNPLKRRNYFMIFLFKTRNGYRQFATRKGHLSIDEKKYWMRVEDESATRTGGCLKGRVSIRKSQFLELKLYKQRSE
ncbi:MAG: hypothetical protein AB2806_00890 [Candidatus Thiodiazotropha sp.]